jgi:hypothetical protein
MTSRRRSRDRAPFAATGPSSFRNRGSSFPDATSSPHDGSLSFRDRGRRGPNGPSTGDAPLDHTAGVSSRGALPPPSSCPIGWQPSPLSPVLFGVRTLGPDDGAPVRVRVFFPSLDGAVETAPILDGCGRYPLVLFCHGYCLADKDHFMRWFLTPAQLARAGYVVMVPQLAGIAGGSSPSLTAHPDEATLDAVLAWARTGWEHADVLLPPPATAVVGHGFGAMLGARFSVGRPVMAYAGLSGAWQDWFGDDPFPLPLLDLPTLLMWGQGQDLFSPLPESTWGAMRRPRHRVVFTEGEHWDYLEAVAHVPCRDEPPRCRHQPGATADLLTMFLGRYLPPELATDLPERIPPTLEPPPLDLAFEQQVYAGGYLGAFTALASDDACSVVVSQSVERLVAHTPSKETHSLEAPCGWVDTIATRHRWAVAALPLGYRWCDVCFPARAQG